MGQVVVADSAAQPTVFELGGGSGVGQILGTFGCGSGGLGSHLSRSIRDVARRYA